jgi:hypothetical protein
MNNLTDLNNASNTLLTFTDLRASKVIFDRVTPTNQSTTITIGGTTTVIAGINIIDIINPQIENAYFQVNVSSAGGATVTWPTLPSGYSVTTIGTGVYRVTGIKSAIDWIQIKNAVISTATGYNSNFTYTCIIGYESSKTKSWTTSVSITQRARLTASASITPNGGLLVGIRSGSIQSVTATVSALGGFRKIADSTISAAASISAYGVRNGRTDANLFATGSLNLTPTKIPGYITGLVTTSYIANTSNAIFATNTPRITDDNPGSSTFRIELSSAAGNFGTSTSDTSYYTYSGTMSQVNAFFSSIYFYPTKNYVSNNTFLYIQFKDGVEQIRKTISLNYDSSGVSTKTYTFTTVGTTIWKPSYSDVKYLNKLDYLVVGGGGGALTYNAGANGVGGGGGGVYYYYDNSFSNINYTIVVGAGGNSSSTSPQYGGQSSFSGGVTANGGNPGTTVGYNVYQGGGSGTGYSGSTSGGGGGAGGAATSSTGGVGSQYTTTNWGAAFGAGGNGTGSATPTANSGNGANAFSSSGAAGIVVIKIHT